jgi:hypothetical protein
MNDNQLVSLSDEALDQVQGGASITFTFPKPSELIKTGLQAVGSVVEAGVAGAKSLLGLFGLSFND